MSNQIRFHFACHLQEELGLEELALAFCQEHATCMFPIILFYT
jgi:hypothetical protein